MLLSFQFKDKAKCFSYREPKALKDIFYRVRTRYIVWKRYYLIILLSHVSCLHKFLFARDTILFGQDIILLLHVCGSHKLLSFSHKLQSSLHKNLSCYYRFLVLHKLVFYLHKILSCLDKVLSCYYLVITCILFAHICCNMLCAEWELVFGVELEHSLSFLWTSWPSWGSFRASFCSRCSRDITTLELFFVFTRVVFKSSCLSSTSRTLSKILFPPLLAYKENFNHLEYLAAILDDLSVQTSLCVRL